MFGCHPLKRPDDIDDDIKVLGSCSGLLCLMKERCRTTVLWNISTGDYRVLPDLPMELTKAEGVVNYMYGLGRDSMNDDYKLVRVARVKVAPTERKIIGKAIVYNLRTNTWRMCEEIPYHFLLNFKRPGTFVCGALDWITVEELKFPNRRSITAFDVRTEKCRQVEPLDNMRCNRLVLGALGGCLCATENTRHRVNVWSMKDYGVKDSWTMLISFRTNIPWCFVRPLAYSKTQDKLLLEMDGILSWYHLKDDELKDVEKLKNIIPHSSEICMESLVQLW